MVTGGSLNNVIGITSDKVASSWTSNPPALNSAGESYGFLAYDGSISHNGTSSSYGSGIDSSKVYYMLIDCDNGSLYFGRDGTPFNSGTAAYTNIFSTITDVMVGYISTANNTTQLLNFGQDPTFGGSKSSSGNSPTNGIGSFYHQPPSGALALCTANLPDFTPTVADDNPEDYFKCVTWVGSTNGGVYNNGVVTTNMSADLVWIKDRDDAKHHQLYDSVRGAGKALFPDQTVKEYDWVASPQQTYGIGLSNFTATSFTVPTAGAADGGNGGMWGINRDGRNTVAWC